MPRDHVDHRLGAIGVRGDGQVGVLMVTSNRAQNNLGESRPQVGIDVHLGLARQALEIDLEPIREAAAIGLPVPEIQRAPESQHDRFDLRAHPQGFDHLRLRRHGHLSI